MKATVVRYQAKPERADENQALVEKVFADLVFGGIQGDHVGVAVRRWG